MRNVYMRPFRALTDAGVMTVMTSFSDLNGVPATGNEALVLVRLEREAYLLDRVPVFV